MQGKDNDGNSLTELLEATHRIHVESLARCQATGDIQSVPPNMIFMVVITIIIICYDGGIF